MTTPTAGPSNRQFGFTLVEVLVALLVLSVGMLGIAALYLDSLRASRAALVRTQAVALAADMADRMRANRDVPGAYDCGGDCAADEGSVDDDTAIDEINEWRLLVENQLPGGVCSIEYTPAGANTPSVYTVGISWTEVGYEDPLDFEMQVEI
jgi:type IV pilus assembly protein PilV